jgi:hypothetical protein
MATVLAGRARAGEGKGTWTDENIALYSQKLFDWLKANFSKRVAILAEFAGKEFTLGYDYMAHTKDKKRLRIFEKFAAGSLAKKAAEKHIGTCLAEFESIREELAAAEAGANRLWKATGGQIPVKEGRIYDSTVYAGRLAVVLDNSRSMTRYLHPLRDEISRDFTGTHFVEVDGCLLERPALNPWFFSAPAPDVNPFTPDRHIPAVPQPGDSPHSTFLRWTRDAPAALRCMVDLMKADSIYWFCDFDDSADNKVMEEIASHLLASKTRLYIHTLDKKVPAVLATLATESGGKIVRKKI